MSKVLYFQSPDGEYTMNNQQFNDLLTGDIEADYTFLLKYHWHEVKQYCTRLSGKITTWMDEYLTKSEHIRVIDMDVVNKNQASLF